MLVRAISGAASRFGERIAIAHADGHTLTYAEWHALSDEAAAGLRALGIGIGDVVALALPSSPEYAIAYAAAAKLGAITAGINPRYTAEERRGAIGVVRPSIVLTTPELRTSDDDVVAGPLLDAVRGRESTVTPPLDDDPDRRVAIVLTSGTTGTPKGAVFCERHLAAIARMDWGDAWGGGGPMLSSTEFAHVGFMTKLPWYVQAGMTMHVLERWRAGAAVRAIAEHGIASVGAIGSQVALMLRDPSFDSYDLSCVKTIVAGGGPSPPALVREARERFGAAYSIRYSSTESGGIGTATAFDGPDEETLRTVGRPRPGVELSIRDARGDELPAGAVGEVCLRSPAVMLEYHGDPVATRDVLRDGWLHTGDLGFVGADGCLRLAGRKKEMYVRGGYNVYPAEVEAVLVEHPLVAAIAVMPRPDDVMGEIGVAVVVPRDHARLPSLDDLRAFGAARLAAYKLPEALRIVDDLPLTPMQKVDRAKLAERLRMEPAW